MGLTFNLAWAVAHVARLAAAIGWLSRQAFTPKSLWQRANLVPVIGPSSGAATTSRRRW